MRDRLRHSGGVRRQPTQLPIVRWRTCALHSEEYRPSRKRCGGELCEVVLSCRDTNENSIIFIRSYLNIAVRMTKKDFIRLRRSIAVPYAGFQHALVSGTRVLRAHLRMSLVEQLSVNALPSHTIDNCEFLLFSCS